jgi:hypothetical protein
MDGTLSLHGNLLLTGDPTTTNAARTIDFTGFDKEGTTDFSDRAFIQHTTNTGGHAGAVLVISSQNDSDDGIAFATNSSSQLKHNSNTIWTAGNDGSGSGLDADTVDGIQGSSFLRSDANDTKSGNLVLRTDGAVTDSTTGLLFEVGGSYTDGRYRTRFRKQDVGGGIPLYIDQSGSTANSYTAQARFGTYSGNNYEFEVYGDINATGNIYDGGNAVWHAGNDGSGSGLDADLLDGQHGSYYAPASHVHSYLPLTGGTLDNGTSTTLSVKCDNGGTALVRAGGDGQGTGVFEVTQDNGSHGGGMSYNGDGTPSWASGESADHVTFYRITSGTRTEVFHYPHNSNVVNFNSTPTVGGNSVYHSGNPPPTYSKYLRSDADDSFSGGLVSTSRDEGIFGSYDSTKTDHIWSMGTSYKNHSAGTNFGNLYGAAYKHTNNSTGGTMGGGHQFVWCNNGTPRAAIGYDRFWHAASGNLWGSSNDGSGSGLDADLLDGQHGSYYYSAGNPPPTYSKYLRSDVADTATGRITFNGNATNNHDTIATGSGYHGGLEVYNTGSGNDAFMAFHTGGDYALYFGLDADTNKLSVGGWSMGAVKYAIWHQGNDGSGSGLDADLLDGQHGSYYAPASHNHNGVYTPYDHFSHTGHGNYTSTTTSALLTEALGDNAFDSKLTAHKTSWSYAGNGDLTDAGRLTELAGTSWLWWTDNSTDNVQGNITGLAIAPNTGGSAGKMFVYNNQGASYGPGWREIWTSTSDGSGSGLDADLLDGQHGSYYAPASHAHSYLPLTGGTVTGQITVSGTSPQMKFNDTDHDDFWIHVNSNRFYILPDRDSSGSWESPYALELNSGNNTSLTWGNTIWTSGNDGSGSGLDADTCDGQHLGSSAAVQFGAVSHRGFTSSSITAKIMGSGDSASKLYWRKNDTNTLMTLDMSGNLTATGNVTAYSDRRIKENISPITEALSKVQRLTGNTYTRNDQEDTATKYAGLIAQEVEDVLPEAVREADDGIKALDYNATIALLVESIKELKSEVDDLKTQLENK